MELPQLETADQVLGKDDTQYELVPCPEWGFVARVRSLSGGECDAYQKTIIGNQGKLNLDNITARLVMLSVVNAAGKRVFDDSTLFQLTKKNAAPLNRLGAVCKRLNGLTDADQEELVKNSGTIQTDSSGSS